MSIDLMNNEFYNAYADSFDKIPFEDVLIPLILKHLPASRCDIFRNWFRSRGFGLMDVKKAWA